MEEFELTFLPKQGIVEKLKGCVFKEMLDIYVPVSPKHVALRIRKSGQKFEMTKKHPVIEGDASHQLETTIPLTEEEFNYFEGCVSGMRISKRRYIYEENNYTYEVDVFQGDLAGLILVDIEFTGIEEKSKFVVPDWTLAEVTKDESFAGGMLCGKKYSDMEEKLEKFGYQKIHIQ